MPSGIWPFGRGSDLAATDPARGDWHSVFDRSLATIVENMPEVASQLVVDGEGTASNPIILAHRLMGMAEILHHTDLLL